MNDAERGRGAAYPHRWSTPRDAWGRLFTDAQNEIGILVYSGMCLAEDTGVQRTLADKAQAGVRVRVLLGDPDSPQVAERGADEGIGASMAAKIRNVLVIYKPLSRLDNVEIRLHATTAISRWHVWVDCALVSGSTVVT